MNIDLNFRSFDLDNLLLQKKKNSDWLNIS